MPGSVSRATVDAFYKAYASGDPERIGMLLDNGVEWHVTGPVDVIHICGSWRGRTAVMEYYARLVPSLITSRKLEIEDLLVDGDRSAMFGRMTARHLQSGRIISHRASHIARYRDGKVVHFRILSDSFDAAEQYLGRRLQTGKAPAMQPDLVGV